MTEWYEKAVTDARTKPHRRVCLCERCGCPVPQETCTEADDGRLCAECADDLRADETEN